MTVRNQLLFWLATLAAFLGLAWLFSDVLLPFVVGIAVAYLLNPLVELLGRYRIPRLAATCIILLGFVVAVSLLLLLALPPLYRELVQLADAAPAYADSLWQRLQPWLAAMDVQVDSDNLRQSLREAIRSNATSLLDAGGNILGGLLSGGRALMGFLSVIVLAPLVAFLMMLEFDAIRRWIDDLIPRQHYQTVRSLLTDIDGKIAGFIRGQLLVALALGILYAVALMIAGLQFGFLIGAGAGLLSIIPLFGSTVGLLVAVVTAWLQSGELLYVGIIAAIFFAGQALEGNVIAPKLLGDSVGLHPIWILFALLAGGAFLGIVGMMLAIPVAATIGVLARFGIRQYKTSSYYRGAGE